MDPSFCTQVRRGLVRAGPAAHLRWRGHEKAFSFIVMQYRAPPAAGALPKRARPFRALPALATFALMTAAIVVVPGVSGCADKPVQEAPGVASAVAVLEPVPAPAGLAAEVFIPAPDAAWKKVRALVGGPATFLPQSFGGLIASMLGLPIAVASHIDEAIPALGAVASVPEAPGPRAALGVHIKAGGPFIDQLTKGEGARFVAQVDAATSITVLTPKGTVKSPTVMGVLGNYLLIGREVADLTYVGPYVARTMPKAAVPKEDIAVEIPDAALSETLTKLFQDRRKALLTMGEALSPALPLDKTLSRLVELAPDLTRARITAQIDEKWVRLALAASPKAGDGPAGKAVRDMAVGDTKPLGELPADAVVGLLDRDTGAAREGLSPSYAAAIERALKIEKMPDDDRRAIEEAMRAVGASRGDWITAGLTFGATGPSGYVRGAVGDKEALDKALKQMLELQKLGSVKDALKTSSFKITTKKTVVEGLEGDVMRVRVEKVEQAEKAGAKASAKAAGKDAPEKAPDAIPVAPDLIPSSIDLLYMVRDGAIYAAAGYDSKAALVSVVQAPDKGNMAGVPAIKEALDSLGDGVSFAILVDPLRLVASRVGKPGAADPAPVVLSLGRSSSGAASVWLRLDVAAPAVRELIKHRNALANP